MLAIIILVGVFYVALNYAEKFQNNDVTFSNSKSRANSFKENERRVNESIDFQI